MKLTYKGINSYEGSFVFSKRKNTPVFDHHWHYHDEYELIYNIKGNGLKFIGDSLTEFVNNELVLVGSKCPHLWRNDSTCTETDCIITKFSSSIKGQPIFSIPEFHKIKEMLKHSHRGIIFDKKTIKKVHKLLVELDLCSGAQKIINVITILSILAEVEEYKTLSKYDLHIPAHAVKEDRLGKIIDYISNNFTTQISLQDIADIAAMTPNALCRFFKTRTGKTIFEFLNDFRIGKATLLLIDGNYSISQVCFESGFNSATSFNRIFKEHKKMSPKKFLINYQKNNSNI